MLVMIVNRFLVILYIANMLSVTLTTMIIMIVMKWFSSMVSMLVMLPMLTIPLRLNVIIIVKMLICDDSDDIDDSGASADIDDSDGSDDILLLYRNLLLEVLRILLQNHLET